MLAWTSVEVLHSWLDVSEDKEAKGKSMSEPGSFLLESRKSRPSWYRLGILAFFQKVLIRFIGKPLDALKPYPKTKERKREGCFIPSLLFCAARGPGIQRRGGGEWILLSFLSLSVLGQSGGLADVRRRLGWWARRGPARPDRAVRPGLGSAAAQHRTQPAPHRTSLPVRCLSCDIPRSSSR